MRWLDSIIDSMDMSLRKLWEIVKDGSLVFCGPWGRKESDTTERLHFPFSLSCIGERNGNPLQCSCLENPRDGRAWWAAVNGVTQSRTRLKRLSSSSSSKKIKKVTISFSKADEEHKIALAIRGFLFFHTNCEIIL